MKKNPKKTILKIAVVLAIMAATILNLRIDYHSKAPSDSFSLSQISLTSSATQAECSNMSTGNNGHCRADGGTGSCVDSYWYESNNCKE